MPASTSDPEVVWVTIQQGGSTRELYIHEHDTQEDADKFRRSCEKASYSTTPSHPVPKSLADHPAFNEALEEILKKWTDLLMG
jgi:hypothetical protein